MLPKGRVKVCGVALVAALASIWAPGCATRSQSLSDAGSVAAPAGAGASHDAAGPVVITGASLLTEGESPRLLLTAERPLKTSVFSSDEGRKVVVDVTNAVLSPGLEPPRADGAVIAGLGLKSFTELGVPHVQLELRSSRSFETSLKSDPATGALSVVLARPAPAPVPVPADAVESAPAVALASSTPAETASAPASTVVPAIASTVAPALASDGPTVLARHTASGHPASRLANVSVAGKKSGVVVELAGDGDFSYEAFRLADPPRYVLDLQGVRNASHKKQQEGSGPVARVRVSQFKSEPEPVTRVVLDLANDETPVLELSKKGLALRFGSRAVEAAPVALTAESRTVPASETPAATSYERNETEDPAERVVPVEKTAGTEKPAPPPAPAVAVAASEPKPEPATTVGSASQDFAEPETASVVEAERPVAAPEPDVVAESKPAPEVKPAAAPKVVVEQKPAPVVIAKAAPANPAPEVVPAAKPADPKPAVEEKAEKAAKTAVVAKPMVVKPAAVVVATKGPEKPKPSAEDRALLEAAETLLEQQQDVARPAAGGGSYESRTVSSGEKVYTGEPITLNLKDADIKDTLQKFSELTGLNIVIDPEVRGSVTVSLTDIPWDQALELILKINGLGYVLEGNVMRISFLGKLTAEESSRQALIKAQDQNRPVRTVIQKLSYASTGEAEAIIRKVMSPRGEIIVDGRNQSLIIRELPDYIPTVLDLIRSIDQPTPQVMIEARIIEATRTFSRNLGVDWNFNAVADQAHGNTTGLIFPNNVNLSGGLGGTLSNGNQLLKLALGNVLNTFNLDATISAAEARGLVKVISSPRVQTQNNQSANIQSGFQIPVQTTVNNTTSVLYVDATLRLEVTPQITAEGTVIMQINVQNRSPAPGVSISGGNNVPLLTRDARTRLLVKDGGTAVIGGIFKVTANDSQNMVPGLWKIPLLGNLFKNRTVVENTDELMIFITPRIMK